MSKPINSTTAQSLPSWTVNASLDPETALMMQATQDASKTRREARERRDAAYQDRISLLNRAADKLRSMANTTLRSGILQGCVGLASAGLSIASSCKSLDSELAKLDAEKLQSQLQLDGLANPAPDAAQLAASCKEINALKDTAHRLRAQAEQLGGSVRVLDAQSRFDPFAFHRADLEEQKARLDVKAEVASRDAERHGDLAHEAQRLETSIKSLLEKAHERRNAGEQAATQV